MCYMLLYRIARVIVMYGCRSSTAATSRDIIRHQSLQEGNDVFVGVFAGKADNGSVEQAGGSHG